MSFGEKLMIYRRRRGLTQIALAERVGLTNEHLSEIERGMYLPKIENVVRIIQELDLTQEEAIDLLIERGIPSEIFDAPSE